MDLLEEAARRLPEDRDLATRLIRRLADWHAYTLHELPTGVLAGADGASIAECRRLSQDIERFAEIATDAGMVDRYAELIERCRRHYRWYADYLTRRIEFSDYASYLENAGRE
jgi:hypothetical protein